MSICLAFLQQRCFSWLASFAITGLKEHISSINYKVIAITYPIQNGQIDLICIVNTLLMICICSECRSVADG